MKKIMTRVQDEVWRAFKDMSYLTDKSINALTERALVEFLRREAKKGAKK